MNARVFHLAIAWDWELDRDFVARLEERVQALRLTSYSISHHNADETIRKMQRGELKFAAFLDRAGEGDDKFPPLAKLIAKSPTRFLNRPDYIHRATDKATMHLEFVAKGVEVPYSVIISPYNKRKEIELRLSELASLGWPFIIKPANTTGGGIGVVLNAASLRDIIETRQHHKNDKYLLQEKITPTFLDGSKAWFRVFFVCGSVIPCWWDDATHIYRRLDPQEISRFRLRPLFTITRRIAEICKLDFFSTEIALTGAARFVTVDYVNEICDMRLQSKHADGVPDAVVDQICRKIAKYVQSLVR